MPQFMGSHDEQLTDNKSEHYVLEIVNYKLQERLKYMHTILVHLLSFVSNVKIFFFHLFRIYIKTYFPEVLIAHLKFFPLGSIGELHFNAGGIMLSQKCLYQSTYWVWYHPRVYRRDSNRTLSYRRVAEESRENLPTARKKLWVCWFSNLSWSPKSTPGFPPHIWYRLRVRPLLRELCTGPNDKRNFWKIVPLSYCGLVMPNFFSVLFRDFWTRPHGIERGKKWSPYQTLKMIGFNDVTIKIMKMNSLSIQPEASAWPMRQVYYMSSLKELDSPLSSFH